MHIYVCDRGILHTVLPPLHILQALYLQYMFSPGHSTVLHVLKKKTHKTSFTCFDLGLKVTNERKPFSFLAQETFLIIVSVGNRCENDICF